MRENPELFNEPMAVLNLAQAVLREPRKGQLLSYGRWNGLNEFDKGRAANEFVSIDAPQFLRLAPKLPMKIAIADIVQLSPYDGGRKGFGLVGSPQFALMGVPARFAIPQFIPMDESVAESLVRRLDTRRRLLLVALVSITRVGPARGDIDYRLERLAAYSDDSLADEVHVFPIEQPPVPAASGSSPQPSMAAIDITAETVFLAELKADRGAGRTIDWVSEARARLRLEQQIYSRNAGADWKTLDPWGPFFSRSTQDPGQSVPAYEKWTRERAALLPETLVLRSRGNFRASGAIDGADPAMRDETPAVMPEILLSGFSGQDEEGSVIAYRGSSYEGLNELVGRKFGGTQERLVVIRRGTSPDLQALLFDRPVQDYRMRLDMPGLRDAVARARAAGQEARPEVRITLRRGIPERLVLGRLSVVILPVTPLSATVLVAGKVAGEVSFGDMPKPGYGLGVQEIVRPPESILPLDAETVDLLMVKHVEQVLTDADWTRMLLSRFALEKRPMPGQVVRWGSHFKNVSLAPEPKDVPALLEGFKAWSRARAAMLPPQFEKRIPRKAGNLVRLPSAQETAASAASSRQQLENCRRDSRQDVSRCDRMDAVLDLQDGITQLGPLQIFESSGPRSECASTDSYCQRSFELIRSQGSTSPRTPLFEIGQQVATPLPPSDGRSGHIVFRFEVTGGRILDRLPTSAKADAGLAVAPLPIPMPATVLSARLLKADFIDDATKQALLSLSVEPIQPRAIKPPEPKVSAGRYDIVGIKLGSSFEDAEKIIRSHMQVGRVLEGVRVRSTGTMISPASSGKLFVSSDGRELVALIDEPPAAPGKVLATWRRMYFEPNQIPVQEVLHGLREKYGPPDTTQVTESFNFWSEKGAGCGKASYSYGGQQIALSSNWTDGSPIQPIILPDGQIMPDVRLPMGMMKPLDRRDVQSGCGETLSVQVNFNATKVLKAGYPSKSLDWVEAVLSDVEIYADMFAKSRSNMQGEQTSSPTQQAKPATGVKF